MTLAAPAPRPKSKVRFSLSPVGGGTATSSSAASVEKSSAGGARAPTAEAAAAAKAAKAGKAMPPAVAPQEAGSVSGSSFGSSVGGSSFHPFQPQRIIPDEDRYAIHQSSASSSSSSSSSSTHTGTAAQPVARRKGVLSQILAASNHALANTGSQTSAQQRHAPGCKRTKSHDALCCVGARATAAGASGAAGGKYGPMPFARSKSWTEVDGGRSTAPGSPMSDGNMLVDKRFMLNFGNGADEDMPSVELHKCRHCSKLYPRTISNSSWTLPHEDPSKFFFCSGECYLTQAVIHAKRNPM